jgi:hypothetical protein
MRHSRARENEFDIGRMQKKISSVLKPQFTRKADLELRKRRAVAQTDGRQSSESRKSPKRNGRVTITKNVVKVPA